MSNKKGVLIMPSARGQISFWLGVWQFLYKADLLLQTATEKTDGPDQTMSMHRLTSIIALSKLIKHPFLLVLHNFVYKAITQTKYHKKETPNWLLYLPIYKFWDIQTWANSAD